MSERIFQFDSFQNDRNTYVVVDECHFAIKRDMILLKKIIYVTLNTFFSFELNNSLENRFSV